MAIHDRRLKSIEDRAGITSCKGVDCWKCGLDQLRVSMYGGELRGCDGKPIFPVRGRDGQLESVKGAEHMTDEELDQAADDIAEYMRRHPESINAAV